MNRRQTIGLLGGAAAWPLGTRAQHSAKVPTVGFLGPLSQSAQSTWTAAFVQRMREHGWIEDRTVKIEYRWAEGRSDRFSAIASEFVRMNVDVIVTAGTDAVIAVKKATALIPIVFGTAGDPISNGLVASLARPGGNVTGLSNQSADIAGKRLDLLREVVPRLRRVAIMANIASSIGVLETHEVETAAQTFGLEVTILEIRQAEDIAPAIEALNGRADALYVVTEPLVNTHRVQINTLALRARLPTLHGQKPYVEAGGLMSYGANIPDLFRRAADFVDRILRGAKPADLPVEQPIKFDFAINLKTAKALGLDVPPTLLARADEVIE
jgi:putative ABC transport system substrate-binding protein